MLDNLKDLAKELHDSWRTLCEPLSSIRSDDQLYCPSCGDRRRMYIRLLHTSNGRKDVAMPELGVIAPCLLIFRCIQCDAVFTVVIYPGPSRPEIAILPKGRGGLSTAHTPNGVAYYLNQAHKAQSVGANSAAIAMFRGALEHLLFEQGYKTGMLGAKIAQLLKDIQAGTAPKWAMELETDFLEVLKDLGNGSIHPNDGDVKKQEALDNELLVSVRETFVMLLFLIYEAPHRKKELLDGLRAKATVLNK